MTNGCTESLPQNNDFGNPEERERLNHILNRGDFDSIEKEFPQYKLVKRREELPLEMDCYGYTKMVDGFTKDIDYPGYVIEHYLEVSQPQLNDIIFYGFVDLRTNVTHMGVVREGKLIESKFGNSHVFQHPVDLVPTFYGNVYKFFRKTQE